jgi:ParB family chromosome partitioning protein
MRHSPHFIDTLFSRDDHSLGKMIPIEAIVVNPDQPRKNLGDLEGLIQSIHNYGVLEPLLVQPLEDGKCKIIAGERRYHAALACGLSHLPCIEIPVENDAQSLEVALVENLQRQELDPFEEAQGYQVLQEKYGYTHEMISQKIGKKRSTITEILAIASMPDEIKSLCRHADISAKSMLLEIAKSPDLVKMRELIDAIMEGKGREVIRRMRKENSRATDFALFKAKSSDHPIEIKLKFKKEGIDKESLISFLHSIIERIEKEGITQDDQKTKKKLKASQ